MTTTTTTDAVFQRALSNMLTEIFDGPPETPRPAADHVLHSAAKVYGPRCIVAILSGMGSDGAEGALAISQAGGLVLTESDATSTLNQMPRAAQEIGAVSADYPIQELGHAIIAAVSRRYAQAS